MKKTLILLVILLVLYGMLNVVGCANPQAENFTKQIMSRPHCVEAIVALKAKDAENPQENELTELELWAIFISGYEAIGKKEAEADKLVNKLLGEENADKKESN